MDYLTKPASREDMRLLSNLFRHIFGVKSTGKFPVLWALERIDEIFPGTAVLVVEDTDLPINVPARCYPDENGNFTIEIKNSVYMGVYHKKIGAYNGFICHEMCHIFLYKLGYTPIFNRQFGDNKIPAYCSVEWQAKALCGEVMMPYNETKNLGIKKIMNEFEVSKGFAETRHRY